MSRCVCCGVLSAVVLALFSSTFSHADTIPPATATRTVVVSSSAGSGSFTGFDPYGIPVYNAVDYYGPLGIGSGGQGGVTAQTVGAADPGTFDHLQIGGARNTGTTLFAISQVNYYFEVAGPTGGTASVNLTGTGEAVIIQSATAATFGAGAELSVSAVGSQTNVLNALACSGDTSKLTRADCSNAPTALPSFSVNSNIEVQTNTIYLVSLWSETYFLSSGTQPIPGLADAVAGVDPTITLLTDDPAYSLSFSSNLTPDTAATPEPGTFLLSLPGVSLGFAFLRNRRRSI